MSGLIHCVQTLAIITISWGHPQYGALVLLVVAFSTTFFVLFFVLFLFLFLFVFCLFVFLFVEVVLVYFISLLACYAVE